MADIMNARFPTLHKLVLWVKTEISERGGKDFVLTDRLKLLISLAAGVVVLSCLVGMHQMVSSLEKDYERAQIERARLEATIEAGGWGDRKQQSQVLKSMLEERLWSAQTPGLADASFERWLRERLRPHKMDPIQQIQVRRVPIVRPGGEADNPLSTTQRMTAKLILPFEPAGLSHFLTDLAEADKTVVIDRLTVRAGRNARVEMDVSAFYRATETN